jgi:hypothetical protein
MQPKPTPNFLPRLSFNFILPPNDLPNFTRANPSLDLREDFRERTHPYNLIDTKGPDFSKGWVPTGDQTGGVRRNSMVRTKSIQAHHTG